MLSKKNLTIFNRNTHKSSVKCLKRKDRLQNLRLKLRKLKINFFKKVIKVMNKKTE